MTIINFLKSELKSSIETLVRSLVAAIKKPATTNTTLAIMTSAAVTVLRKLDMSEEINTLGLVMLCHFGGKGKEVPEAIANLFAAKLLVAPALVLEPTEPIQVVESTPVASVELTPTMTVPQGTQSGAVLSAPPVHAPLPAERPARAMNGNPPETPESRLNKWLGILSSFLGGHKIDLKKTVDFTSSIFRSGVTITPEQWQEVIFPAMKYATARHIFFVGKDLMEIFLRAAPQDQLNEYVFGQDGLLTQVLAELGDVNGEMVNGQIARAHNLVDALEVLDGPNGNLSEIEIGQVKKVGTAVRSMNGPAGLIARLQEIVGIEEETSEPATATIGEIFATKKFGNQEPVTKPLTPAEEEVLRQRAAKKARRQARKALARAAKAAEAEPAEESEAVLNHKLDQLQEVAEAAVVEESVVAEVETPEPTDNPPAEPADNGDKPSALDPEYEAEFAALMAEEEAIASGAIMNQIEAAATAKVAETALVENDSAEKLDAELAMAAVSGAIN